MNPLPTATLVLVAALNGFPQDKPAAQDDHHQGVIERGDHDELVALNGLYAKLARIQNTTFIEEGFEKLSGVE